MGSNIKYRWNLINDTFSRHFGYGHYTPQTVKHGNSFWSGNVDHDTFVQSPGFYTITNSDLTLTAGMILCVEVSSTNSYTWRLRIQKDFVTIHDKNSKGRNDPLIVVVESDGSITEYPTNDDFVFSEFQAWYNNKFPPHRRGKAHYFESLDSRHLAYIPK